MYCKLSAFVGARHNAGNMLAKLNELQESEAALRQREAELKRVEDELKRVSSIATRYDELKQRLELKQSEAQLIEEKLAQSTHGQQLQDVTDLQASITDSEELLAQARQTRVAATKRARDLEDKMKNAKAYRERELKEADAAITKAKKTLDESKKKTKAKEQVRARVCLHV